VIANRTNVSIVTRGLIQGVNTPLNRVATIGRADIVIVTCQRQTAGTFALRTLVAKSTGIAIVTLPVLRLEETANIRIARICSARIVVIAGQRSRRDAASKSTMVACGADIAVVAGSH